MERKALAFKLMVDPKNVRRAVAIITGETLTDEEIDKRFFDKEPAEISVDPSIEFETTIAFTAFMLAEEGENSDDENVRPMSKFAQRMQEAQRRGRDKGDSL